MFYRMNFDIDTCISMLENFLKYIKKCCEENLLQSDRSEKRLSQYRQMNGGRFLVSLREVLMFERILKCRSLLKENVNIWEENFKQNFNNESDIIDT